MWPSDHSDFGGGPRATTARQPSFFMLKLEKGIILDMNRWKGGPGDEVSKRLGRRLFLYKALLSGGLASIYPARTNLLGISRNFRIHGDADVAGNPQITPTGEFYKRNHFPTPTINEDAWNLEIAGLVAKPLKLSYTDLLLASSVSRPTTIECAGNPSGGPDEHRNVDRAAVGGTAEAGGHCDRSKDSDFSWSRFRNGVESQAPMHFARAIPLEKAMDSLTLLAYEMNGQPLPADHGFPLRALVAGWYGMDSVKWLTRIEISDKPFDGYFQQEEYVSVRSSGERQAITAMRVNSKILSPAQGEKIHGKTYQVRGVAWAGEQEISKVEVKTSADGAWYPAVLAPPTALAWRTWSYDWRIAKPGAYTLQVRATDNEGNAQPEIRDPDRRDIYELNFSQQVKVNVLA